MFQVLVYINCNHLNTAFRAPTRHPGVVSPARRNQWRVAVAPRQVERGDCPALQLVVFLVAEPDHAPLRWRATAILPLQWVWAVSAMVQPLPLMSCLLVVLRTTGDASHQRCDGQRGGDDGGAVCPTQTRSGTRGTRSGGSQGLGCAACVPVFGGIGSSGL